MSSPAAAGQWLVPGHPEDHQSPRAGQKQNSCSLPPSTSLDHLKKQGRIEPTTTLPFSPSRGGEHHLICSHPSAQLAPQRSQTVPKSLQEKQQTWIRAGSPSYSGRTITPLTVFEGLELQ